MRTDEQLLADARFEDRARRRHGIPPIVVDDEEIERIEAPAAAEPTARRIQEIMEALPEGERRALTACVVDERGYDEIAAAASASEAAIRKRVSRAPARLRAGLEGPS